MPSQDGISSKSNNDTEASLRSDGDDYDPHAHRNVAHPTTNFETLVHLLKGSFGTGILAMPLAFHQAGYLPGIVCTLLIGFICTYGLHILVRSQYILCKKSRTALLTYPVSMKMALEEGPPIFRWLAPAAVYIVDGFLIFYQMGICCVYVVFVATNLRKLVDVSDKIDIEYYILMLFLPLIALMCIRNLKLLAPFSTVANVITFVGIILILSHVVAGLPSLSERELFGEITEFPLFFGTTLFAIEAVGVVITLEGNMKTPKSFRSKFGVLNVGMLVVTLVYTIFGFLGYWKYGASLKGKGSITTELPRDDIRTKMVQAIFTISIFISYGLQCYVSVEIIWTNYLSKRLGGEIKWEFVVRFTIVLVTFVVALIVPLLNELISLIGALSLSMLGITFPAIMEICVLWPDKLGRFNVVVWRNGLLIIIGFIGLIVGTSKSLLDIVENSS